MSVIELVKNFLQEQKYLKKDDVIDASESLLERGAIDSVGVLKLVALLEEKYGIKTEVDDMMPDNFDSLAAIRDYVRSKNA